MLKKIRKSFRSDRSSSDGSEKATGIDDIDVQASETSSDAALPQSSPSIFMKDLTFNGKESKPEEFDRYVNPLPAYFNESDDKSQKSNYSTPTSWRSRSGGKDSLSRSGSIKSTSERSFASIFNKQSPEDQAQLSETELMFSVYPNNDKFSEDQESLAGGGLMSKSKSSQFGSSRSLKHNINHGFNIRDSRFKTVRTRSMFQNSCNSEGAEGTAGQGRARAELASSFSSSSSLRHPLVDISGNNMFPRQSGTTRSGGDPLIGWGEETNQDRQNGLTIGESVAKAETGEEGGFVRGRIFPAEEEEKEDEEEEEVYPYAQDALREEVNETELGEEQAVREETTGEDYDNYIYDDNNNNNDYYYQDMYDGAVEIMPESEETPDYFSTELDSGDIGSSAAASAVVVLQHHHQYHTDDASHPAGVVIEEQEINDNERSLLDLDRSFELTRAEQNEFVFSKARHNHYDAVAEALHEGNFDPHAIDAYGNTLLHICAQNNRRKIASIAIKYGCEVNAVNFKQLRALDYCQMYSFNRMADWLVQKGARNGDRALRDSQLADGALDHLQDFDVAGQQSYNYYNGARSRPPHAPSGANGLGASEVGSLSYPLSSSSSSSSYSSSRTFPARSAANAPNEVHSSPSPFYKATQYQYR